MRFQLRVRTMMAGVMAAGCSLGVLCGLGSRGTQFGRLAEFHHRAAWILHQAGGSGCMDGPGADESLFDPEFRRAYLYHRDLGGRYSQAARWPWLSVRPDPTPEWAYPEVLRVALGADQEER